MTSPILSGLICIVKMRGAYLRQLGRAAGSALSISCRMCSRPLLRLLQRLLHDLEVSPSILMSIWIEVMPFAVPATLKSMSPR